MPNQGQANYNINHNARIELHLLYPISCLVIIRKTLPFMIWIGLFWLVISLSFYIKTDFNLDLNIIKSKYFYHTVITISLLAIIVKALYEFFYIKNTHYRVCDGNMSISNGIIFRRGVSLPLSKITDFYFHRNLFDVCFGLTDLHVNTPSSESGKYARICGLNTNDAHKMRERLKDLAKYARISENSVSLENFTPQH